MAKDVNLSSQEWLDIVFDGKNKEFGAYVLRANTVRRNNKAVIIVLAIIFLIVAALIAIYSGVFTKGEEDANAGVEQQGVTYAAEDEEDDEMEQIDVPEEKQPEPEPEVEQEIATVQNTEIVIKPDAEVKNEVKSQEDLAKTDAASGGADVEGKADLTQKAEAKEVEAPKEEPKVEPAPKPVDNVIYNTANVQQPPQFPGGDAALYGWINSHIAYPPAAAEEGVDGRVVVSFMVDKDGSIKNVAVVRGRHPALDREAIRVVSMMPPWQPGRNNGEAVRVTYTLPVMFKLQK